MRASLSLSFLANVLLSLAALAILPEQVAVHFGLGGVPDGWASREASVVMAIALHTLLFLSFDRMPGLLTRVPTRWISLPHRDYWLKPELRRQTAERFGRLMRQFGVALFLFLFFAGLLTVRANLADPVQLDERSLLIALAVFLGYTLLWTLALLRAFRVPRTGS